MQVVLSGFSVILLCFDQAKTLHRYGALGGSKSAVYILNSVGERTSLWGTPV